MMRTERCSRPGEPNAVIELAEHALAAAERALEHIDDSDAMMREVIERLEAAEARWASVPRLEPGDDAPTRT